MSCTFPLLLSILFSPAVRCWFAVFAVAAVLPSAVLPFAFASSDLAGSSAAMVALSYRLEVAEPGQLDPQYRARSCPSVDLSLLGSPATVADLKHNVLASIGCLAAVEVWGPSIHNVRDNLHLYGRRCTDLFYLLAGQLYRQGSTTCHLDVAAELPPLADLSMLAGKPLLRIYAFKKHPAPVSQAPGFDICIKTLAGQVLTFSVGSNTMVEELKEMLHISNGIPPQQQLFIHHGMQLEDGRTLSAYGIDRMAAGLAAKGSSLMPTLHLVQQLRGGMWHPTSGRYDNEDMSQLPWDHTEVTVAVPGLGELQLTVPADVIGPELLQLVQQAAAAAVPTAAAGSASDKAETEDNSGSDYEDDDVEDSKEHY